jgi:hypothetical protein
VEVKSTTPRPSTVRKRSTAGLLVGVARVGKAALFCLGLLAMLAVVLVITILTPVMLAAAALPTPALRRKRDLRSPSARYPRNSVTRIKNYPDAA